MIRKTYVYKLVLVNILILFILCELVSLGLYYFEEGQVFYIRSHHYNPTNAEGPKAELTNHRIHPYFGIISRPNRPITSTANRKRLDGLFGENRNPSWIDIRTNNYGFYSYYDYPFFKSNNNQYLIGIFGGSVAQWFSLQGKDRLIDNLKKYDFLKNKEIIILNFGSGANKQPEQLQILSYFLSKGQEFDMVVNIDGFNEVALSNLNYKNNLDISMPNVSDVKSMLAITFATLNNEPLQLLAAISHYKTKINKVQQRLDETNIASYFMALRLYHKFLVYKYHEKLTALEKLDSNTESLLYFNQIDKTNISLDIFEDIAAHWAEASIIMNQILASRNIPYLHIIQPNQYYSKRAFAMNESKIAINKNSKYKEGVERGYPYLIKRINTLRHNDVSIFNATNIFDAETKIVYADDCCHYNQLGNEILADLISGIIIASLTQ